MHFGNADVFGGDAGHFIRLSRGKLGGGDGGQFGAVMQRGAGSLSRTDDMNGVVCEFVQPFFGDEQYCGGAICDRGAIKQAQGPRNGRVAGFVMQKIPNGRPGGGGLALLDRRRNASLHPLLNGD